MHNLSYKSLFLIVVFLLIPIVFLLRLQTAPKSVLASWWNDSWTYRQAINVSSHSVGETNVYIIATVNIGTTTKSQADNGDFRFVDQSGQILSYYINANAGTTAPTFHIFLPVFSSGAQIIYTYYGNPSASNGFSSSPFTTQASNYTIGSPVNEETGGGPIAWWKFDEGVGTTAFDASGKNNHGVFGSGISAPTWTDESQCITGKCLKFDGANDRLTIPDSPTVKSTRITVSAWIKPQFTNTLKDILNKYNSNVDYWFLINSDNKIYFYTGNTSTANAAASTTAITSNQWYFITGIYDGIDTKIYINGKYEGSATSPLAPAINTSNVLIGDAYSTGRAFLGTIDDVKIYPYARSASQIKADYTSGLAGQSSSNSSTNMGQAGVAGLSNGLIGYWKFDEGIGGTSTDSSNNNKLSTFCNTYSVCNTQGPTWSPGKFGSAPTFDGIDDGIKFSGTINTTNLSHTLSAWIYLNTTPSGFKYIFGSDSGVGTFVVNNNLGLQYSASGATSGSGIYSDNGIIPLNQWVHVITTAEYISDSQIKLKLFKNGSLVKNIEVGVSVPNTFYVRLSGIGMAGGYEGNNYPYSWWSGSIDEARIYNRAITIDEAKDLYEYTPGPIGYWKFEESTGTTAYDSSGNNKNGSFWNPISWVNGKIGKAINLGTTQAYIQTSLYQNYNLTNYTLNAWIYPTNNTTGSFITNSYDSNFSGGNTLYVDNNTTLRWSLNYAANVNLTAAIPTGLYNKWSHISATASKSGSNTIYTIYVNGISVGSTTANFTYTQAGQYPYRFGVCYTGFSEYCPYSGSIDDVKIYNYARSQSQIVEDMNVGSTFVSTQVGQTSQTIGGTTTSLEYCIPGDSSPCASPIAEWKFEEGTGTTAFDSSGNTYNLPFGIGDSSPTYSTGKFGKSLLFTGNDYVGQTAYSLGSTGPVTINTWVKTNSGTAGGIISRYGNSGRWTYRLYMDNTGKIIFNRGNYTTGYNTVLTSTTSINNNQWHYLSARYDGSTMKIYIDGTENISVGSTNNSEPPQGNFCIGTDYYDCHVVGTGHFNGSIDHVRIYNYARTPAQIAYDYNKGEPIAWWKLDECQGSATYDSSGIGNTGSISIGASGSQTSVGTCTTSGAWFNGTSGKNNSSLSFDGIDDYINTSGITPMTSGTSTVSLWAKLSSSNDGKYLFSGIGSCYQRPAVFDSSSHLGFYNGTSYVYGSKNFNDNNFHHIVIVDRLSPSRSRMIYVDGVTDIAWNDLSGAVYGANTCYINMIGGYGGSSAYFQGQLDDIRIYNYSLTSNQVKTLYNGGALNFR